MLREFLLDAFSQTMVKYTYPLLQICPKFVLTLQEDRIFSVSMSTTLKKIVLSNFGVEQGMEKEEPKTIQNKLKRNLVKSLTCPLYMCTYLATCLFWSKVVKIYIKLLVLRYAVNCISHLLFSKFWMHDFEMSGFFQKGVCAWRRKRLIS